MQFYGVFFGFFLVISFKLDWVQNNALSIFKKRTTTLSLKRGDGRVDPQTSLTML